MSDFARRLLGAAAAAVARKLLPNNPGSALAMRSPPRSPIVVDRSNLVDTLGLSQTRSTPPPALVQPVAPPAPPPRRRRKVVVETITYEVEEG